MLLCFKREMTFSWQSYVVFNHLVVCFWGENDFVRTIVPFIHFFPFSIWKWHTIFMYLIYGIEGKQCQSRKPMLYYLDSKDKQLYCENYFYRVFIIISGMTTSWSLLINICIVPLLGRLFSWWYFTLSQFSTGLFR